MSSEIIQSVAYYDNYDDFQQCQLHIFHKKKLISLFWGLFNDETKPYGKVMIQCTFIIPKCDSMNEKVGADYLVLKFYIMKWTNNKPFKYYGRTPFYLGKCRGF